MPKLDSDMMASYCKLVYHTCHSFVVLFVWFILANVTAA